MRAAKNRRRIFLNEFPKAGRDQPAVRRPPIERLPYARLVFRRFRVTTACAPKLKKRIFFTQNDLTNNSIQLNKKSEENQILKKVNSYRDAKDATSAHEKILADPTLPGTIGNFRSKRIFFQGRTPSRPPR